MRQRFYTFDGEVEIVAIHNDRTADILPIEKAWFPNNGINSAIKPRTERVSLSEIRVEEPATVSWRLG